MLLRSVYGLYLFSGHQPRIPFLPVDAVHENGEVGHVPVEDTVVPFGMLVVLLEIGFFPLPYIDSFPLPFIEFFSSFNITLKTVIKFSYERLLVIIVEFIHNITHSYWISTDIP